MQVGKSELEKNTGDYLPEGETVKVYIRSEKTLMVLLPGQPDYELVASKPNEFDVTEKGEVTAMSFIQPNGKLKEKRKK